MTIQIKSSTFSCMFICKFYKHQRKTIYLHQMHEQLKVEEAERDLDRVLGAKKHELHKLKMAR